MSGDIPYIHSILLLPVCNQSPIFVVSTTCLCNFFSLYYFYQHSLSWNKFSLFCLGYFNNLLIGLSAYNFYPLQSVNRIISQKQKWSCSSAEKPLIGTSIHQAVHGINTFCKLHPNKPFKPDFFVSANLAHPTPQLDSHRPDTPATLSWPCSFRPPPLSNELLVFYDQAQMLPTLWNPSWPHGLVWLLLAFWF